MKRGALIILLFFGAFGASIFGHVHFAAAARHEIQEPYIITPRLQVDIPGIKPFTQPVVRTVPIPGTETERKILDIDFISVYLIGLYQYLVGIAAIAAGVMIVWAGFRWLTSGGAPDRISDAKKKIAGALVGMALVFGSYLIVYLINPDLVFFKPLRIQQIERIELEEAEHGGGELRAGAGATDPYRLQSCDGFATNGQEFQAYFTHYHKPTPYGSPDGFTAAWILENTSDPSSGTTRRDSDQNSAFFCAVAMECSCPGNAKDNTKRCYSGPAGSTYSRTGRRHGWAPCAPFGRDVEYCNSPAGLSPGNTVAADRDCFYVRAGCELLIDGRKTVKIIDSGSGIRGRRFDLFTSNSSDNGGVPGGVHTVKITNPTVCRPCRVGEYKGKCTTGRYRGGIP